MGNYEMREEVQQAVYKDCFEHGFYLSLDEWLEKDWDKAYLILRKWIRNAPYSNSKNLLAEIVLPLFKEALRNKDIILEINSGDNLHWEKLKDPLSGDSNDPEHFYLDIGGNKALMFTVKS